MPNGDKIVSELVEQAHEAIARGDASDIQMLIAVNHAEGVETRRAICEESKGTRDLMSGWAGLTFLGRKWTPVELAFFTGLAIGTTGIGIVAQLTPLGGS